MGYTHGEKWTHDKIKKEILSVMKSLEIDRMPTRNEIRSVLTNDKLTNKISKTLGYYGWAKELEIDVKENDTYTGKQSEKYVIELLNSLGYKAEQMLQNFPYDILVNDVCKIDVKFSHLYKGPVGNFYSFALRKDKPTCDFYILVAEDPNQVKKIYVVPSAKVIQKQIGIGQHKSIYEKYKNRFDLIESYISFYSKLMVG